MSSNVTPHVVLNNGTEEYFFEEGCYIAEWWNSPDDAEASVARARVRPACVTRWHRLDGITERYVILQGAGRVEVGHLPAMNVSAGDVVVIPAGVDQRITNVGSTDLIFLAVCTPRFIPEAYEDTEDQRTLL